MTLEGRGIKIGSANSPLQDDATLIVELTAIEPVTRHKPGPFFSTIVWQDTKINFTATLRSKDKAVLFRVDGRKADESLDKLTKTIGRWIGNRAASHFTK